MTNSSANTTAPVVAGATPGRSASAQFLTLGEFKERILGSASATLNVVKNPHTGKMFVAGGAKNYKIQSSMISETAPGVFKVNIPVGKEVKFLYTDGDLDNGCIVLATKSNNVVATL